MHLNNMSMTHKRKYSGRNTTHAHKWANTHAMKAGVTVEQWIRQNPHDDEDCIVPLSSIEVTTKRLVGNQYMSCIPQHHQTTVFDVQWSNCPVEVEAAVKELWRHFELGNDFYFLPWSTSKENIRQEFPAHLRDAKDTVNEYLLLRKVSNCLIYWWW